MKNKILQSSLEARKIGRGLGTLIEHSYGIHLGVADKFLLINQLNQREDLSLNSLWRGVRFFLERFGYTSIEFQRLEKSSREYEKRRAKRTLNGEYYSIG